MVFFLEVLIHHWNHHEAMYGHQKAIKMFTKVCSQAILMTFISDLKINFIMFEFYHVKLIF